MVIGIKVDDVEAVTRYCGGAGCEVTTAPADAPWGERYAECVDPYGYAWKFFQLLPGQPGDSVGAVRKRWFG